MRALHQDIGKPRASHNERAGSVMVAVLGVSMILMLAGVTMVVLSRQSMHRIQRMAHYAQAQAVAEAGIADMIAKLGTNYAAWTNATCTAPFFTNGAYYDVTTRLQANSNVLITSDGIYMEASNRTIMEVRGTVQTHNNEHYSTNSAIMSDGVITLASGAYDMYGDVHANGNVTLANGDVFGTVTSAGDVNPSSEGLSHQPERTLPEFNFDSYLWMANHGGTYVEGTGNTNTWKVLSGSNLGQPATNGILYVNGNLSIANQSSFTGTIVVNGNIKTANKFTHTQFPGSSNMPSLLSTGAIDLNNHETYNGVIYARTTVNIKNKITIRGGVISGGITYIKNGVDIYHGTGYPAWDPLNPEVSSPVIAGAWLK